MATRFRFTAETTAPAVSPALQSYSHNAPSTVRRVLKTSDSSALAQFTYTPDAADHLVAGDALLVQYVGDEMLPGHTFSSGDTIKFASQFLEAHAGNNVQAQLFVAIVSADGGTVRRTLRSKVLEGTELATARTNRFLSTTQDGANYTTVIGDRLVVELSLSGTPTGAGGVQGHNGSIWLGGNGAGGDLPENDTSTATNLNPWIEFVPTITFNVPISGSLSVTLADATASGAGQLEIQGSTTATLAAATLAAQGQLEIQGALTATLEAATLAGTGTLTDPGGSGSLAVTLDDATVTGDGDLEIQGSLSVQLAPATVVGSGQLAIAGALNATLESATLNGQGTLAISGGLAATLEHAVATGVGQLAIVAQLVATLAGATVAGTGSGGEDDAVLRALCEEWLAALVEVYTLRRAVANGKVGKGALDAAEARYAAALAAIEAEVLAGP